MFKITKSFVDCTSCQLYECPSAIADTNCSDDLMNVDLFIIAENPAKTEVTGGICDGKEYPAGTPLIGKSGTFFRKILNRELQNTDIKYFITNSVLCQTINPDGTTGNPTEETIELCKTNVQKMIDICQPKLILTLGRSAMHSLGIEGSVTKEMTKLHSYKNYDVLVCTHPSQAIRLGGIMSTAGKNFENCIIKAKNILTGQDDSVESSQGEYYQFTIDDKFYTDDYKLIDIQYISFQDKLIFIFRDKENNKVYHTPVQNDRNYYWYESTKSNPKLIEKFEDLSLKIGKFNERSQSQNCFESDISLPAKHAVDYYIQNKNEPSLENNNIFFFDFEIYTYDYRGFPDPEDGNYPISAVSFALDNGIVKKFLLQVDGKIDKRIDDVKDKFENFYIFKDERQLIQEFINEIHRYNPDYITGWNVVNFDLQYLYSRMKKLKMDPNTLSPFNNFYINAKHNICEINGYVVIDMMTAYKNLTYTNEESYKLEYIAQKNLGIGKEEYDGNLMDLYEQDIETYINYFSVDTELLQKLNNKLNHIALQDELRRTCTTTHKGASSTTGLADGLFNYNLKTDGYVMKNASKNEKTNKLIGAYVRVPEGGIYDWVIDFDYTSLYPSIICSFNIGPDTLFAKISKDDSYIYRYMRNNFKDDDEIDIIIDPVYTHENKKIKIKDFEKLLKKYDAIVSPSGCIFMGHSVKKTFFYPIIKSLFNQRTTYKDLKFDAKEIDDIKNMLLYDNKQMSYKILLNSLYGILAQRFFRFFNFYLAETITLSGRELISFAGQHVDNWMVNENNKDIDPAFMQNIEDSKQYLRYCDTDSLFLWMKPYLEKKNLPITVDNIVDESKKIDAFLNDELLSKYCDIQNIIQEESMFKIKNELVCKRYYTLHQTKKKYCLHVVAQEGVKTNELDVKGLETVRSDIPDVSKKMLNELLNRIMLSEEHPNVNDLFDYVEEVKQNAYQLAMNGDPSIYKKVTFKKPLEEYKVIGQHIKGMLIWNSLENDYFRKGHSGTLYPIQGLEVFDAPESVKDNYNNNFLKQFQLKDLDVIVVPEEIKRLPNYYKPNIKKIVEFSVTDRANILLGPLAVKSNDVLTW